MIEPKTPPDETARLEALRSLNILDTAPEERFDRLTRMAMRMFGVPIALVSLVDENRQWFKSCMGLEVTETPRKISFCGHTILGDDVFVVPNALEDNRFADNPLVADDPHIRFYAGCPLRALDGSKLGTLCIIDREERELSTHDLEAMRDLASMVENELAAVEIATMDDLTGVLNRRGFMLVAQHSLGFYKRQGIEASLAFIDLNNFKPINDAYGHSEGDKALQDFADLLKHTFRASDLVARMGGDEFAVLLTNTSYALADETLGRLQKAVDTHNADSQQGYDLSFSYGLVQFDAAAHTSVNELLAEGDSLMYAAKQASKNKAA